MNMPAFARAPLAIEIIYDLVCPWCFIGTRRLMRVLRRRPEFATTITWRPFLLNPDMPAAGMSRADYLVRKFGAEERARRLFNSITQLGEGEDILFRFDQIRRSPSSVDAHRLVRLAAGYGRAEVMANAIFTAYFTEGLDIGQPEVLLRLAMECGLERRGVRDYLASEAGSEEVQADNLRAHRLGINGAPCFVLGRHHAIAGAQDVEVLDRLLTVAAFDAAEG